MLVSRTALALGAVACGARTRKHTLPTVTLVTGPTAARAVLPSVLVTGCVCHEPSADRTEPMTHSAENGLPVDTLRQFLAERDVILCRTCMQPLTWETRTEPGFLPRQGWYDDARTDPIVCFRAADYRHVPLTDREWAYYEAGRASVTSPEGDE